MLISRISRALKGGSKDGIRAASMDFPDPGGPIISRLCPPAAAISAARLAFSCPLMSFMSGKEEFKGTVCALGAGRAMSSLNKAISALKFGAA